MPKITVAIASYNHAPYVREAIESALSQEGCDLEVIVVDDGSKDGTVDEIKKINDHRLRLICFPQNLGACVALNRAIQEGSGDYVAVLNSDDVFMPKKLQKQLAFLEKNPGIAAGFGLPHFIDEKGQSLPLNQDPNPFQQPNRTRHEWLRYFFYHSNALCHPTVLIRRSCYTKYGNYDPRYVQAPDYDFWLRLLLNEEITVLQESLLHLRIFQDGSNVSAASSAHLRRSQWEVSQILKNYLCLSPENYLRVFPEDSDLVKRIGFDKGQDVVAFALACRALGEGIQPWFEQSYRLFGLQVLHELLGKANERDMTWLMPGELTVKDHMHFTSKVIFERYPSLQSSRAGYLKRLLKRVFSG